MNKIFLVKVIAIARLRPLLILLQVILRLRLLRLLLVIRLPQAIQDITDAEVNPSKLLFVVDLLDPLDHKGYLEK